MHRRICSRRWLFRAVTQVWVAAASAEEVAATTASTDQCSRPPAERRARIVRSEVRQYTNRGVTPPPSLARYAVNYVASFLSDDEAEEERVIGPEDFVKDKAEEARALAQTAEEARALAQTAEAAAAKHTPEEADRRTALRAVEASGRGRPPTPRGWWRPPASRR
jgi:hypothetical protein